MKVTINRAPVLTLWAAIVAERMGFPEEAALTLGRALAGYTAQSKGRMLGIYHERPPGESEHAAPDDAPDLVFVDLMGKALPALATPDGVRAAERGRPADPERVRKYLRSKFGESLPEVERAMRALAGSYPADRLAEQAYALYEKFRPAVDRGKQGWGAAGVLDTERILALRRT